MIKVIIFKSMKAVNAEKLCQIVWKVFNGYTHKLRKMGFLKLF